MTRQEIENDYKVRNGIIVSPGKFEDEPIYAPYFYDAVMNGFQDDTNYADDTPIDVFYPTIEDAEMFPELGDCKELHIWTNEQGFIFTSKFK